MIFLSFREWKVIHTMRKQSSQQWKLASSHVVGYVAIDKGRQCLNHTQGSTSTLTKSSSRHFLSVNIPNGWNEMIRSLLLVQLTLGGRTSMLMMAGTGNIPREPTNTVTDKPYIGTQLLSGSWSLYMRCMAKTNIPSPVPNAENVNIIFRPRRSMRNIVNKLAASCTIQINVDDWSGVKDEPASAKKAVV